MKKTTLVLLFALCVGPAAAAPKPISRKMGGAVLGMSVEKTRKKLSAVDAPKILADISLPGEKILVFPKAKAKGTGHFLGHFRDGKLRRLEWTFEKGSDWGKILSSHSLRHGNGVIRQERVEGGVRDTAEWSDGKTSLGIRREPRPEGLGIFGSLEDVTLSKAAAEAHLRSAGNPAPSTPDAQCLDFGTCYDLAGQRAALGGCAEALRLYSRAIELKPGYPWSWYSRAVIKRALGDDAGAKADLTEAVKRKAAAPDFTRTSLEKPNEKYGPQWACTP